MNDEQLQNIRLVATDMDGTLTNNEKLTSEVIKSIEQLIENKIFVVIVTGRSAGWVNAIANYLPITGAIAENGGLFYSYDRNNLNLVSKVLIPIVERNLHRQELFKIFKLIQAKYPQIKESDDNIFRITDWTFDVEGLTNLELQEINYLCQQQGWSFTYSNVQCHIKPVGQDKASALLQILSEFFPKLTTKQVVTIGDSPNDESLFDSSKFPISIGVANIDRYLEYLQYQPLHITSKAEGQGFCELVELIVRSKYKNQVDVTKFL
jgi:HAD superfamily hydrolase (TIGR01484 family)